MTRHVRHHAVLISLDVKTFKYSLLWLTILDQEASVYDTQCDHFGRFYNRSKMRKNNQKMIREQFETFPALLQ